MTLSHDDTIRLIKSLILKATDEMCEMRLKYADFHVIEKLKIHAPIHVEDLNRQVSIPDSYFDRSIKKLKMLGLIIEDDGHIELEIIK